MDRPIGSFMSRVCGADASNTGSIQIPLSEGIHLLEIVSLACQATFAGGAGTGGVTLSIVDRLSGGTIYQKVAAHPDPVTVGNAAILGDPDGTDTTAVVATVRSFSIQVPRMVRGGDLIRIDLTAAPGGTAVVVAAILRYRRWGTDTE